MKTAVRIQETERGVYKNLTFQILRHRDAASLSVETIGYITWQADRQYNEWYGIRYEVQSTVAKDFQYMASAIKLIQKNCIKKTPKEVFDVLNCEEYYLDENSKEFVSVLNSGKGIFKIYRNDNLYTKVIAETSLKAADKAVKMKLDGKVSVHFSHELKATAFDFDQPVIF